MNNFTKIQKRALETLVEAGARVASVCYDPVTHIGTNPETTALAAGWVLYYREASTNLVEAIYTK